MTTLQKVINPLFHFKEIKEELENKHLIVKEGSYLYLVKYNNNSEESNLKRMCRGIILDKKTNVIVNYGLNGKHSLSTFKNLVNWDDCVVEESIDGTMVNLYYYDNKWNTSTKSTINANCKWRSNKTFREIFLECDKKVDYNRLNKNYCYTFIMTHADCRNVTLYKENKLYHVCTRNLLNFEEIDVELGIDKPKILKLDKYNPLNLNSYNNIQKYVHSLSYDKEGVMLFSKCRKYRTKIKSPMHIYVNTLLGNNPDIVYKLLELRVSNELWKKTEILKYYKEYESIDKSIDSALDKLQSTLYNLYIEKKMKHNDTLVVPTLYGKIMYSIHQLYLERQTDHLLSIRLENPKINLKDVGDFLLKKTDISYLYLMVKELI